MRSSIRAVLMFAAGMVPTATSAQAPATPPAQTPAVTAAPFAPTAPQARDAAAMLLNVYVFPANNQTVNQQATDSNACFGWARQQTGVDPTNPTVPAQADTSQAGRGSVVRGGARGAVAGTAIGAIAGDAGRGAAIGATAGGMAGVGNRAQASQQAQARAQQQQQAAVNAQIDSFRRAYTACMEGKKYIVR